MRLSVTIGFSLLLLLSLATQALAQYQNPDWIDVSPAGESFHVSGESFHVSMPYQPKVEVENAGAVSGNRYIALTALATYTVWSMTDAHYRAEQDTDTRLDATAELLWDGLLKSAREELDEKDRRFAGMSYVRELPAEGLPGREYTLTIGPVTGTAQLFLAREHIYVLLAMGKPGGDWPRENFFASFRTASSSAAPVTASEPPKPSENNGGGTVAGASGVEDYNRIFTGREVTSKVRILEKPEPTYSENARRFGVQGTVVLRAVFAKDGQVTNLHVVTKLPHGLTKRAVDAARAIRFVPAMKDGQAVSMWMELQYNFNLY
jgi:TonB family protein